MSTDQFRSTMTTDPRNAEAARKLALGLASEALAASKVLAALYGAVKTADTDGELVDPRLVGAVLDNPLGYGLALQRLTACITPEHERMVVSLRAELAGAHAKAVQTEHELRTDLRDLDGGLQ